MVDLGLSVKWDAINLGANSPDGYGGRYAWGEFDATNTLPSSQSVTNGRSNFAMQSSGVIDADSCLTVQYDVATQIIGNGYRKLSRGS